MKNLSIYITILLVLSGCTTNLETDKRQNAVYEESEVDESSESVVDSVETHEVDAKSDESYDNLLLDYGITENNLMTSASFGSLGETQFSRGVVLLWLEKEGLLRTQAIIQDSEIWHGTNNIHYVSYSDDVMFLGSVARLNNVGSNMKEPLWSFMGISKDPEVETICIEYAGESQMITEIENETWLYIYQGRIGDFSAPITFTAYNSDSDILYTDSIEQY